MSRSSSFTFTNPLKPFVKMMMNMMMTATYFQFSKLESSFSKKKIQRKIQKLLDKLRVFFITLVSERF